MPVKVIDLTDKYSGGVRIRDEKQLWRIVIHHDAAKAPTDPQKVQPRFASYDRMHDDHGGIPYHYAIDPWGRVFKLRRHREITAHVRRNNTHSLGVMLMGYFHNDASKQGQQPTVAQLEALEELIGELVAAYKYIKWLTPHRKVPHSSTACPGNLFPYGVIDTLCARHKLKQL
jgi:N-acetyl-anhydromuramyl-L-alanine amidase AmpD